jgi:transposase
MACIDPAESALLKQLVRMPQRCFHVQRLMWAAVVAEAVPVADGSFLVLNAVDAMAMVALLSQCPEHALNHAILLRAMRRDERQSETVGVLRSIPGIGPVASSMLGGEMPEIGTVPGEEAAALTGLAPVAHDSGTLRGKRAIAGGRRALRHVMFQAALVAAHHNPSLRSFADRLRRAGKPHKVIITAVARKLVTIANALRESRQKWTAATA